MIVKRGLVLLFFACTFLSFGFVSGASVSISDYNDTLAIVSVSSASNLYAYEVNFDYGGTFASATSFNFLGSGTSFGSTTRGTVGTVYESKLDSTQTGVTGSGEIFNVTHSGDLSLRSAVFVSSSGSTETDYYNESADPNYSPSSNSSTSSGSSGSGSGGATVIAGTDLLLAPRQFNLNTFFGEGISREIIIINRGTTSVNIQLKAEGASVTFSETSFTLAPEEEKTITINIQADERGLITGKILLITGSFTEEIPLIVDVRSQNFLFDSSISLGERYRRLVKGTNLKAQVNLLEVGSSEKVDVVATYVVKDFSGRSYIEESETFFVQESKEYIKELPTSSLPLGKYVLGLEIVYPGAFATSSTQFEVVPLSEGLSRNAGLIIAVLIILVLCVLTVIWSARRKHRIKKIYRRH